MTVEDALARQTSARGLLRDRTLQAVTAAWSSLPSYDRDQIEGFVARILPIIEAGQATTGQVTAAFIAQVVADQTGEAIASASLATSEVTRLRPVAPEEVYQRPFVQVYTGLKNGTAYDAAVAAGLDRLTRLVDDDLSLAHRRATLVAIGQDDRVTGYRRVIRPELASTGTCGLCIAASDRVYGRANLMPVHSRCGCEVMPIVRTRRGVNDPGRTINGQDISELYRGLPASRRSELASQRFSVHDHGELGPVLRPQGEGFTGPSDIAA